MRKTVLMHVCVDGIWSHQTFTITETRRIMGECMKSPKLVSGPKSVAQAMRDIMDEQTVECVFTNNVTRFELS